MKQFDQMLKRLKEASEDILNYWVCYQVLKYIGNNNIKTRSIHNTYYDLMRVLYDSICTNAFCLIVNKDENAHYLKLLAPVGSNDLGLMDKCKQIIQKEKNQLKLLKCQTLEEDLTQILEEKSGVKLKQITHEIDELEFYRNRMVTHADDYDPIKKQHYYPYTKNLARFSYEILRIILQVKPKFLSDFNCNQSFDEYINQKKIEFKKKLIGNLHAIVQSGTDSIPASQNLQIISITTGNDVERLMIRQKAIAEDILRYYAKYKFINDHKFKNNFLKNVIFNSLVLKINILFGEDKGNNRETHYLRLVDKISKEIVIWANKILNNYDVENPLDRLHKALLYFSRIHMDDVNTAKEKFKAPRNNIAHASKIGSSIITKKDLEIMVKFSFGLWGFLDARDKPPLNLNLFDYNEFIQKYEDEFKRDLPILVELLQSD